MSTSSRSCNSRRVCSSRNDGSSINRRVVPSKSRAQSVTSRPGPAAGSWSRTVVSKATVRTRCSCIATRTGSDDDAVMASASGPSTSGPRSSGPNVVVESALPELVLVASDPTSAVAPVCAEEGNANRPIATPATSTAAMAATRRIVHRRCPRTVLVSAASDDSSARCCWMRFHIISCGTTTSSVTSRASAVIHGASG